MHHTGLQGKSPSTFGRSPVPWRCDPAPSDNNKYWADYLQSVYLHLDLCVPCCLVFSPL